MEFTAQQTKELERRAAKRLLGYVAIKLFTGFFFVDFSRRIDKKRMKNR